MAEKLATLRKKGGAPKVNSGRGSIDYNISTNTMWQHYYFNTTDYASLTYNVGGHNANVLGVYVYYDGSQQATSIGTSDIIDCSNHTEVHFAINGSLTSSNSWAGLDFSYSLT